MAARYFFVVKPSTISCHCYCCCLLLFIYKVYLDFPTHTLSVSLYCFVHCTASFKVESPSSWGICWAEVSVRTCTWNPFSALRCLRARFALLLEQRGRSQSGSGERPSFPLCTVKLAFSPPLLLMMFNDRFFVGNFSFFCGFFQDFLTVFGVGKFQFSTAR